MQVIKFKRFICFANKWISFALGHPFESSFCFRSCLSFVCLRFRSQKFWTIRIRPSTLLLLQLSSFHGSIFIFPVSIHFFLLPFIFKLFEVQFKSKEVLVQVSLQQLSYFFFFLLLLHPSSFRDWRPLLLFSIYTPKISYILWQQCIVPILPFQTYLFFFKSSKADWLRLFILREWVNVRARRWKAYIPCSCAAAKRAFFESSSERKKPGWKVANRSCGWLSFIGSELYTGHTRLQLKFPCDRIVFHYTARWALTLRVLAALKA